MIARALFWGVLLVAFTLRARHIGAGFPDLFEEATPFFRAFDMVGGLDGTPTADPRFYRYPSLAFYVHAAGQALLVAWIGLRGGEAALRDLPATYLADRTPFLMMARVISVLFSVLAVAGVWMAGRRLGGLAVAIPAALILALNPILVDRSQLIDVDGPLVALVAWGLWACLGAAQRGSLRDFVGAGAWVGLAASAKYPGAFLFAAVVAAAAGTRVRWAVTARRLGAAGLAAAVAFAITSPFLLIRSQDAVRALQAERQHMAIGHFGLKDVPSVVAYASLAPGLLGWLVLAAAAAGVWFGFLRQRRMTYTILAFVLAYGTFLVSAKMHADRYLFPLFPAVALFAAFAVAQVPRPRWRALATCAVIAPAIVTLATAGPHTDDPRTEARRWIETNIPVGSFLVMEAWGPDLLEPIDLWTLSLDARRTFLARRSRPLYGILNMPAYQVMPVGSEAYYDTRLYADADLFVLSSEIGDRYRADPKQFARQVAFYGELPLIAEEVAKFGDAGRGPRITVLRMRGERLPFAHRTVAGPQSLAPELRRSPAGEAAFFRDQGLLYETFGFLDAAILAYAKGYNAGTWSAGTGRALAQGFARCLVTQGRRPEAIVAVEMVRDLSPDPREKAVIGGLAAGLRAEEKAAQAQVGGQAPK